MPIFAQHEKMERQLVPSVGYDALLPELLKQALFPYITAVDGFDCGRCSPLAGMFLRQLADYNFVKNKSNLVLVENSVVGKTHLSITLGMDAYGAGIPWGSIHLPDWPMSWRRQQMDSG